MTSPICPHFSFSLFSCIPLVKPHYLHYSPSIFITTLLQIQKLMFLFVNMKNDVQCPLRKF